MTPPPAEPGGAESVDDILDTNAHGLLYFERFLPLACRVPGVEFPPYVDVCAGYDEQRGLNLGALGHDADAVGALSAVLGEQLVEQVQLRRVLQLRWHGEAGEAVQTYLSAEQEEADAFARSIEDSHQTMCAAVDVLRDAVTDKAELVGGLPVDNVDGKDADQIDAILAASGLECLPVDRATVFPRLASAFPDLTDRARSADVSDEFAAEVGQVCRDWIENEFVPRVQGTYDAIVGACTATDTAVRGCLKLVVDILAGIHEPSFGDLDERGWALAPGPAAQRQGPDCSPVGPASAGPGPAPAPAAVGPASVSDVGGTALVGAESMDPAESRVAADRVGDTPRDPMDGLVDRVVAAIVDRVENALSDTIDGTQDGHDTDDSSDPAVDSNSAIDSAVGGDEAKDQDSNSSPEGGSAVPAGVDDQLSQSVPGHSSPAATDERGHLEAELDGHRARIALEHNGVVSLELETPGVGTRSFELRVGPFGLPEIVEVPDSADPMDTPAVAAPKPSEPVPAAQPPVSTTEPAPATEPVPSAEPVVPPGSASDASAQCPPESPDTDQPDAQLPVTADRPVTDAQPADAQPADAATGAGLSEAGEL
ncbi:hypothetical protein MTX35_09715 [Rhodococcus sp. ARC_M12]|uniref:hypothetical protein n=1 Tax=Rhodococcus sp. ARC_M12 TaxID=2928854 RepID=UPI001FB342D8|nr:hypothetical protein [Rhodococcus sp. ARC_M12]MCJ0977982.1 hypothetical protein [Rhodococcus sp. ARC_M12]